MKLAHKYCLEKCPKNRSEVANPVASQVQQLEPQTLSSAAHRIGLSVVVFLSLSQRVQRQWVESHTKVRFLLLNARREKKKEKIKLHLNGNPAGVKQQFCDFSLEATRGDGAFCSSEDLKRAGDAAEEFTAEPDR